MMPKAMTIVKTLHIYPQMPSSRGYNLSFAMPIVLEIIVRSKPLRNLGLIYPPRSIAHQFSWDAGMLPRTCPNHSKGQSIIIKEIGYILQPPVILY